MAHQLFIKDLQAFFDECKSVSTQLMNDSEKFNDPLKHGKTLYILAVFQAVLRNEGYIPESVELILATKDSQLVEATAPWDFNVAKDKADQAKAVELRRKLRERVLRRKALKEQI